MISALMYLQDVDPDGPSYGWLITTLYEDHIVEMSPQGIAIMYDICASMLDTPGTPEDDIEACNEMLTLMSANYH